MRFRNVCALIGAAILGLTLFGAGPAVAEVSQTSYERSGTVIDVADSSFSADVLQAQGPVLVAFRAEWSAVCRALDPVLVDVARAHGSQLTVARLDIDQSPQTPPKYNVTAIPTLDVFKNGSVVATRIGPASRNDVERLIAPYL